MMDLIEQIEEHGVQGAAADEGELSGRAR
jgi:hypothetical protein